MSALLAIVLALGWLAGLPVRAAADGPTTFANSAVITILDPPQGQIRAADPYPSTVTVTGMAGAVTKVTATLTGLTHGSVGDIDVLLVSPTNENLLLMSDIGAPSQLVDASNDTLTFDDAAAGPVTGTQLNLPSGTYKPTNIGGGDTFIAPAPTPSSLTTLDAAFTGIDANGTWRLFIVDDIDGEDGQLAGGWSLTITTAVDAAATTTTVVTSDANVLTGESVTFTATVRANGSPVTDGDVQFTDGGANLGLPQPLNGSGQATLPTNALTEGTHQIRAIYQGATGFLTSTSNELIQRVDNETEVNGNTFCNTGTIAGPDSGASTPYPSNIFVSGLAGEVTKVTATLTDVFHTAPIDFDILLSGPTTSQNLFLLSDAGGQGAVGSLNLTFDDAAASSVPNPAVSGTFRPTRVADESTESLPAPAPTPSSATALSTFNGASPNGTWSLWVVDDASGDAGSISGGWCLTIEAQVETTTELTAVPASSIFGQSVTFTASVTGDGDPVTAGSVEFSDGATVLGTVALGPNGTAPLTTSTLTVGTHSITARYLGTDTYSESEDPLSYVVGKRPTVTELTSSVNPSDVGELITFTATVTDDDDPVTDGSVQFSIDGAPVGGPLTPNASGQATFQTADLTAGTHPVVATYAGTTELAESDDALDQVVDRVGTSTALVSSVNPSEVGEEVTFTATVTRAEGGAPVTSGTVQFRDGTVDLGVPVAVNGSGVATFVTDELAAGTHPITAMFIETDQFGESTSPTVSQVVDRVETATGLVSSVNPSEVGEEVTFTATVTRAEGGAPVTTGSVQFRDGGVDLGAPVPLEADGTAAFPTAALAAGTHSITAMFIETDQFAESTSSAIAQVVGRVVTTTTLTTSGSPSLVGESVTFTATVTRAGGGVVTGSVQFLDDGVDLGAPVSLEADGTAAYTTAALAFGTHPITARFIETAQFAESTSSPPVSQVVNRIATTTTLISSLNPSLVGESVTFTATVTVLDGGGPVTSGSVQFWDGTTPLDGPVAVNGSGVATYPTVGLTAGTHEITATFAATPQFSASESATPVEQIVNRIATTTSLTSSLNPSVHDDSVTFTATVTRAGGGVVVGAVQFRNDGVDLGSPVPVAGDGTASYPTDALPVGTHPITATFLETDVLGESTSAAVDQEVQPPAPDIGGPYEIAEGASLTLTGSGTLDGVTYSWDLNDDGNFTDATGATPTLSWTELEALGIDDGLVPPAPRTIRLRASLNGVHSEPADAELTITNTAPTSVLTGGLTATVGVPFTIKVGANDPSAADMAAQFIYTVDWGDGSPVVSVPGPADPPVTHVYLAAGNYQATFTATDKDGGTGPGTQVMVVAAPAQVATPTPTPTTSSPSDDDDDDTDDTSSGGGNLAATGATIGLGTLLASLLLLGGGVGLLFAGRRRSGRREG